MRIYAYMAMGERVWSTAVEAGSRLPGGLDGLYVVSKGKGDLCRFLESVFTQVGTTFAD